MPNPAHAEQLHQASLALRPRCWCGCPEAAHLPPRRHQRRSCPRCGPQLCVTYVPHTEHGSRVTTGHRIARYLSDLQVKVLVACLGRYARPPIPASVRIPAPRPVPAAERRPSSTGLRRADL